MTESRDNDILLRKKVEELEQKCLRYEQVIMGIVERFVRVEETVVECEKCIDYEKDNIRLGRRLGDLLDNQKEAERVILAAHRYVKESYSRDKLDRLVLAVEDYYTDRGEE